MGDFFEIAKSDFVATFEGGWIFLIILVCIIFILIKEEAIERKLLLGGLPLFFLFLYWCPLTGILLMKILGEDIYWRILWLILPAVVIPYGCCLFLRCLKGYMRYIGFAGAALLLIFAGKNILGSEDFEASTNAYKVPQYVVDVCELLPENVHVLASNRLTPYLRLYDVTLTLEYARNAMLYNGQEQVYGAMANLYQAVQEEEIDVAFAAPLAKEEGCTFLILSSNKTYSGDWEDYGYTYYGETNEFTIFVDQAYEEGMDTRKWEE